MFSSTNILNKNVLNYCSLCRVRKERIYTRVNGSERICEAAGGGIQSGTGGGDTIAFSCGVKKGIWILREGLMK